MKPPFNIGDIVDMTRWDAHPMTESVLGECRITRIQAAECESGWETDVINADGIVELAIDSGWAEKAQTA